MARAERLHFFAHNSQPAHISCKKENKEIVGKVKKVKCRRKLTGILVAFMIFIGVAQTGSAVNGDAYIENEAEEMYAQTNTNSEEENNTKELDLYARSAVLMDAASGRILVEKDGNKILPMASTTKIMTCILVLEQGGEDDVYPVSSYAAQMPKVKLGAVAGEEYYGRDLLYSLMLESHNDAAVILAEGIGGSVEQFAEMMNKKAEEIGCENTHFVTPNGLDAQEHYTTAADLARIMRYCIEESEKKEDFLKITQTRTYTFSDITGKRSFSCQNHNAFLDMMDGALSGKTGFTGNAGYCYVGALKRDGKTFIVALLACGWPNNKTYKWSDTKKLMEYGLENYEIRNVWQEIDTDPVLVLDGIPESGDLKEKVIVETEMKESSEDKQLSVLLANDEKVEINVHTLKTIHAPVEKGTCVGSVEYVLDGVVIKQIPLVTKEAVEKIDFWWALKEVWMRALGIRETA